MKTFLLALLTLGLLTATVLSIYAQLPAQQSKPAASHPPLFVAVSVLPPVTATAAPGLLIVHTPTTVTVSAQITDTSVLPTSVNLIQLHGTGTQPTILGELQNTGDGNYVIRLPLTETTVGEVQLQVSAAFKGILNRSLSNVMLIDVWKALHEPGAGFIAPYPPNLYTYIPPKLPGQYYIQTSPKPINLGGALPPAGSVYASSGYLVSIVVLPAPATFDITSWLASTYPSSQVDTITDLTVAGISAYQVTFENQIGAGEPLVLIPHNGFLYEISYGSTFAADSPSDQAGLTTFNAILQSFMFTQ
jgi:hypothetical protein